MDKIEEMREYKNVYTNITGKNQELADQIKGFKGSSVVVNNNQSVPIDEFKKMSNINDLSLYLSANNKETFEGSVKRFLSMKDVRKPMVFEVFTERQDESNALEQLLNVQTSIKYQLVEKSKKVLKNILSENSIRAIRKWKYEEFTEK